MAEFGAGNASLMLFDYTMTGAVVLHWTLVLTVALACVIVRVMKGPAYVVDAYPLPDHKGASMTRPWAMSASMRAITSRPSAR